MRVRIEYFPNPNCVIFHIDKRVTDQSIETFDMGPNWRAEEQPQLVKGLFTIEGIDHITLHQYGVGLVKADVFEWDEIVPKAETIIKKVMDPNGEIVRMGTVRMGLTSAGYAFRTDETKEKEEDQKLREMLEGGSPQESTVEKVDSAALSGKPTVAGKARIINRLKSFFHR
jgi:hypothetical protein